MPSNFCHISYILASASASASASPGWDGLTDPPKSGGGEIAPIAPLPPWFRRPCYVVVHFQAADQFPLTPCWENMAIMAHTLWLLFEIRESFFQQIILDAGVPKTFFSRIIVLAVFFSVNSIVVILRELTTKTLCLSIRTIASQWDKIIYEREAFLCLCSFIYEIFI